MIDPLSRRDWLKAVGAAGAGALVPPPVNPGLAPGVTTVLRGVPRGKLSSGGSDPFDPKDNEVLWGYPFGGGDLFGGNTAGGMGTPLAVVQASEQEFVALSSLDDRVRTKRFYFQPGE